MDVLCAGLVSLNYYNTHTTINQLSDNGKPKELWDIGSTSTNYRTKVSKNVACSRQMKQT